MAIQRECGDTLQVQAGMRDVEVPRSIPKLTTRRVLTMSFVEGDPITRLKVHLKACCPTAHSMVVLLREVQCCFVKSDLLYDHHKAIIQFLRSAHSRAADVDCTMVHRLSQAADTYFSILPNCFG